MWAGYEEALVRYGLDICAVWTSRGRADTCATTLTVDLAAACGAGAGYAPRTSWPPPVSCRPGWAATTCT